MMRKKQTNQKKLVVISFVAIIAIFFITLFTLNKKRVQNTDFQPNVEMIDRQRGMNGPGGQRGEMPKEATKMIQDRDLSAVAQSLGVTEDELKEAFNSSEVGRPNFEGVSEKLGVSTDELMNAMRLAGNNTDNDEVADPTVLEDEN